MSLKKEFLHSLFVYANGEIYWKNPISKRTQKGDKAGSIDGNGYLQTGINNKNYKNHRIIFCMFNGFLPTIIDHIDGNPLNNKIENLREVTKSQNSLNAKLSKANTSGVKNVTWETTRQKWRVQVYLKGKRVYSNRFDNLELAELVATEARNKYHGEYANHG